MASLKSIRNRIRSVKNTQQITRAMKMVSAAKLRRAQDAIFSARPYAEKMEAVLHEVARLSSEKDAHPLLVERPAKNVELIVVTSDRGLCGGFNTNIHRRAHQFLNENRSRCQSINLQTIGRRGYEYFKRRNIPIRKDHPGLLQSPSYLDAEKVAADLSKLFTEGQVDAVWLIYNEFVSAISQKTKLMQLLPINPISLREQKPTTKTVVGLEYEPDSNSVLRALLPRYFAYQVWRIILESVASEHGARMSAMDSATDNAADMIQRLSLQYNQTRQAGITKELMEIVSGAEAQH